MSEKGQMEGLFAVALVIIVLFILVVVLTPDVESIIQDSLELIQANGG